MWWLVGTILLVAVLAAYVTWIATRLERLHTRAADASAALVAKLNQRAETALSLADTRRDVLGGHTDALRVAAFATLDALPPEREPAENDLTRVLRQLPLADGDPAWDAVRKMNRRVAIAKQVHTDVVRDALAVRDRRMVRMLRLNRKLDRPLYFNMDDPS
ncbi:hypothetical protein [Stackebrandtia soli]|uniref:hypothetical protein n=1 Tax=Stackebrandtia soli TaxID=1892856 RepID=UPI0039EBDB44